MRGSEYCEVDGARLAVGGKFGHRLAEVGPHVSSQRIELFRSVEDNRRDRAVTRDDDGFGHGFRLRWSGLNSRVLQRRRSSRAAPGQLRAPSPPLPMYRPS